MKKASPRLFSMKLFVFARVSESSPGRTRTYDKAVNSRSLYQLSYRGIIPFAFIAGCGGEAGSEKVIVRQHSDQASFTLILHSNRPVRGSLRQILPITATGVKILPVTPILW